MQSASRKNVIIASLTKRFIRSGKTVKATTKEGDKNLFLISALSDDLVETEYETEDILNAIKEDSYTSEWEPRLSRIITILRSKDDAKKANEIEQKWLYFLDYVIRPKRYEIDIEPWAYDIKRLMGLESRKIGVDDDLVWVKKDFVEHVTRQINGEVEIRGQGEEWQLIDGQMKLQAPKKQDDRPKMIGQVLESKEEYEKVSKFKIKRYLSSLSEQEFKALNDEVFETVKKESFVDDLGENNTFFKAMAEVKINQVVLDRIKQQESIKPILKVG